MYAFMKKKIIFFGLIFLLSNQWASSAEKTVSEEYEEQAQEKLANRKVPVWQAPPRHMHTAL